MRGKKNSKIVSFLTLIVFLLVIVAVVGAVVKYTHLDETIKDYVDPTFRVKYDGVVYTGNDNIINLPQDEIVKFEVKGTNGFKIKVTPNVTKTTNFTYTANGQEYSYGDENLTGLIIKSDDIYGDCFYIDCTQDYSLEKVLSRIWGGAKIVMNGSVIYPYLVTVTSSNGETVNFSVCQCAVIGVVLPEHIIF